MTPQARLSAARAKMAAILEGPSTHAVLPFGDVQVDGRLPGGGLPLGRWHEVVGEGLEIETGAASGAFVAALTEPLAMKGAVVWVMRRDDLYAPGLAGIGFPAEALIQVCVRDEAEALGVVEDALGSIGVAAAVAEVEGAELVAGRRLQLACERRGATGFLLRRRPFGGQGRSAASGSAAATRWRIASAPSEPAVGEPGLGAPRWRVELERCRGGRPGAWIMEKRDGEDRLRVVALLGDRQLETPQPARLAG